MSNQVYANSTTKYYEMPGLTQYLLSADEPAPIGVPIAIPFNSINASTPVFPGLYQFNPSGTDFKILKSGMYSVIVNIAYKTTLEGPPPTPEPTNVDLFIELNRPGEFNGMRLCRTKINAPAQLNADEYNVVSVSFVTYLRPNDLVKPFFTNLIAAPAATEILRSNSSMIISKIN